VNAVLDWLLDSDPAIRWQVLRDYQVDLREGQPWTATEPTLTLLRTFGVDPTNERVRRGIELIRDNSKWEHEGQRFFDGEVEPCINGRTVALAHTSVRTSTASSPAY
jgi:hypothetical protein